MMNAQTQVRGDIGNPKGTGYAKIRIEDIEAENAAAALVAMDTFVDALKGADFTDCNVGNTSVTEHALQGAAKPASDVNVDSQLVVTWRHSTELRPRRLTIPGIDPASTLLESKDGGRRLTTAGAATLAGLIETMMGWGLGECVIIEGKHLIVR